MKIILKFLVIGLARFLIQQISLSHHLLIETFRWKNYIKTPAFNILMDFLAAKQYIFTKKWLIINIHIQQA